MLREIRDRLLFPFARAAVNAQSTLSWWRARGKPDQVIFDRPYDGRPAMLLALYQKGRVRPDVWRMLRAARALDLHIVAVNTLRLQTDEIEALKEVVDCYIERPNFGRDFGSYRTGFLHIFDRGWSATCPRLLMLNDSVFFSETRVPAFLRDMMESPVEVLGATENFDMEHHVGSFSIAVCGSIIRNPKFQTCWKKYTLTDVRPAVIRTGELALSRLLKKIVSSPSNFRALYSADRFISELQRDDALLDFSIMNGRSSNIFPWRRITMAGLVNYVKDRHMVSIVSDGAPETKVHGGTIHLRGSVDTIIKRFQISNFNDVVRFFQMLLHEEETVDVGSMKKLCQAFVAEAYMRGSQIHQNSAILLYQGLPIIKLDGLYRGIFNLSDVENLTHQLEAAEQHELRRLLMERPYGGETLVGWKRAAFMRGYL